MRSTDETIGIHLDESLEARALRRWGQHEFEAVERDAARQWRVELAAHDARVLVDAAMGLLPRDRKISSLEQLKAYVDELCISRSAHVFDLAMDVIGIGATARNFALTRWNWRSRPPLAHFAPYTAHVVKVDLVFHLAIARGFISGERPSNRVDMAYLYYAPFANVFVSGDRLHHRTVPFFQTPDQAYLTCRQLKDSLAEFDAHYEQLPNEIKRLGVMRFALCPPSTIENAVTRLWDRYMHPDWRSIAAKMEASVNEPPDLASEKQTVAELNERLDTATVVPDETAVQDQREGPDYWLVKRFVAPTKGRWQILPDDLAS